MTDVVAFRAQLMRRLLEQDRSELIAADPDVLDLRAKLRNAHQALTYRPPKGKI